jgi:hypothetical protein
MGCLLFEWIFDFATGKLTWKRPVCSPVYRSPGFLVRSHEALAHFWLKQENDWNQILFVTQRDYGIDVGCAASGNVTCKQNDRCQQD